ncbi:hypothetical protein [Bacillus sp. NPDC094106]|uniref:hypothetical protein n=1 Tax=Bacillus sp. NPDC094106 TaxID=3363949 RepID=UPI00381F9BFA
MRKKEFFGCLIGFSLTVIGFVLSMSILNGIAVLITFSIMVSIYQLGKREGNAVVENVVQARIYERFYSPIYAPEGKTVLFERASENTYRIFTRKGEYLLSIYSSTQGIGYEYQQISKVNFFEELA